MINSTAYSAKSAVVAHPDYCADVIQQLGRPVAYHDHLFFYDKPISTAYFSQDIWHELEIVKIDSIGDAAKQLKPLNPFWFPYPIECIRRMTLIQEKLRNPFPKQLSFPLKKPFPDRIGVFGLLDQHTLVYSLNRSTTIPFYRVPFAEDKINPPNRAYLKLWEAFAYLGLIPKASDIAIDLGASPGGWTHVLAQFCKTVYAVDKAPLEPKIAQMPSVKFIQDSAFGLDLNTLPQMDWLCSDIACYPDRLYRLVNQWLDAGKAKHFICTIKLQGEVDFKELDKFKSIPNAHIIHLYQNKHELTFIKVDPSAR